MNEVGGVSVFGQERRAADPSRGGLVLGVLDVLEQSLDELLKRAAPSALNDGKVVFLAEADCEFSLCNLL